MADKLMKGFPFLQGDSVYQDVIRIASEAGGTYNRTYDTATELIPNVWTELKSKTTKAKSNSNGYWYWEFEVTDGESGSDVKIKFECPKPDLYKFQLTNGDFDVEPKTGDTDWTKYWKAHYKGYLENHAKNCGVQPSEVVLNGSKYYDQEGNLIELPTQTVHRGDFGDLTNLLNNTYGGL